MQTMAQKGLLKSEQGAHGGYHLLKDVSKVSFYELVEMIEGPIGIARCMAQEEVSGCEFSGTCNIVSPVNFLNERLIGFYKNLSLLDLVDVQNKKMPKSAQAKTKAALQ
jgi:DNA-binding IscR family transcriptional regulator